MASRCSKLAASLLALAPAAAGAQLEGAADGRSSRVHYVIEARVGAQKELSGTATLRFENATADSVDELWFHLYHNAFSSNGSTHLWEGRGRVRGGRKIEEGWGWQRLTSITIEGEERLGDLAYESPDDDREQDRTVCRLPLATPLEPGGTLEFELSWDAQLPRVRRRTGYKGNFILAAHWFPKLAKYEEGRGWNAHQFHRDTEFYADFGTYDVTLDLPAEYDGKIGASGVQAGPAEVVDGRVRTRFLAPSEADRVRVDGTGKNPLVHGFAWTADPDYSVHDAVFEAAQWKETYADEVARVAAALGRTPDELVMRDVEVRLLIQPERQGQWKRHFDATCTALFFYGLWFGEYPYERITVVDPAWGGGAAGGMEYPTLFTCGTRLFTAPEMQRPEGVTVHEAGHQFWYGLVGNNEFEAAWMDEGFNSYTDSEALFRRYGPQRASSWYSGIPVWGRRAASLPSGGRLGGILTGASIPTGFDFKLSPLASSGLLDWWRDQPLLTLVEERTDPRWNDRTRYLSSPDVDPIDTFGWKYFDRNSYGTNSYPRPAVALRSLPALVGADAFLRGMRHYSESWRYRHPYPDDFFEAFVEGSGEDVRWYFDEAFRGTATVDWRVDVAQWREPKPSGFLQASPGEPFVEVVEEEPDGEEEEQVSVAAATPEAEDEAEDDAEDDAEDEEGSGRPWHYEVSIRRRGTLRLPVRVEVRFEGGEAQSFEWTRESQADSTWWKLPLEPGGAKLEAVVVDPERLWYLDTDMSNNQWYAERDRVAPLRWSERVLNQYVHLMRWYASIGG